MDTRLQALQHLKNLVNETIVEDDEISFFINYILMEDFAYGDDKSIHGGSVPGGAVSSRRSRQQSSAAVTYSQLIKPYDHYSSSPAAAASVLAAVAEALRYDLMQVRPCCGAAHRRT